MDFGSVYCAYFRDVFLYSCSLSGNESIAEEIAQETFVKALRAIDRFDGSKDIRAWLFTIAKILILHTANGRRSMRMRCYQNIRQIFKRILQSG